MDTKHTHSPCCSPAAPKAHAHADHEGHKHDHAAHSHADDHDHGHDHGVLPGWPRISAALVMALLAEASHWLAPQIPALEYAGMALAVVAIGLSGLGVYQAGLKSLAHLQLGIHALMAVAVTGAFLIGQWPEAAMVMALYAAAERIEDQAMDRARLAIRNLLGLAPDTAEVLQPDGSSHTQPTAEVPTGATVRVPPGARIPLDGTITAGHSSVNQAPITGESVPVDKTPGDSVWAGSINQQAELQVQVTAATADSMLARIVKAVEQAQARKAPTQRFVDRFAAIYTPIVMVLAMALAVLAPLLLGWAWLDALYQALALLVIACPCALVLSTPVTVVSALTAAARHGVLLKGGSVLESARHLRTIALDKTGTLTTGQPALVAWEVLDNATTSQADAALLAWQMASRSAHPVSHAIAQGLHAEGLSASPVQDLQALPGRGVQARIRRRNLLPGQPALGPGAMGWPAPIYKPPCRPTAAWAAASACWPPAAAYWPCCRGRQRCARKPRQAVQRCPSHGHCTGGAQRRPPDVRAGRWPPRQASPRPKVACCPRTNCAPACSCRPRGPWAWWAMASTTPRPGPSPTSRFAMGRCAQHRTWPWRLPMWC